MALDSIIPAWLRNRSPEPEAGQGAGESRNGAVPQSPETERRAGQDGVSPRDADSPSPDLDSPPPREGLLSAEAELRARREEIVRMEERALRDLESARTRLREADRRTEIAEERERNLDRAEEEIEAAREARLAELEQVSGLSRTEARKLLLKEVEEEAAHQAGLTVRRIEEEARLDAERRARGILAVAMQRLASGQSIESNTQVIHLPNEEMKGRIIGKDGRNIRALENLTGVDIIIDETPETVVVSSFDGVRREVGRLTLEKLIEDGRIHPASCEAAYEEASARVDDLMVEAAESALLDARVTGLHPELVRLLGRLRFRTSYSQNVLSHLVECSNLAALMAAELGASVEVARRAALLHDVGKAVSHEVEGTHAAVGARLARRYEEVDAITHAIEAHHNEIEPVTVEAVIVQAADALSGARPGARGNSMEQYVSRLGDLEEIALRQAGVKKVFAMQAGREIRIMVDPGQVDDDATALISHEIAAAIEREMEYPGQIKITVIRELRSTRIAR
ncbi:MAG: ribonuclease Y [Solirubrobacterales bacterium]|nr:ribonuclease Y [Solirubrobacterales bacterium]HRV59412.1 ribonuclease Y [Solirubrobacterales bacterium]